jgi:hypothetical protein
MRFPLSRECFHRFAFTQKYFYLGGTLKIDTGVLITKSNKSSKGVFI